MNDETGNYEALDLDSLYTVASNNFILLECGDGMTMFAGAKVVRDTGILDVEILENYIVHHLGGVIDEAYAEADCHIAFTEGEVMPHSDVTAFDAKTYVIWIAAVVVVLVVLYRKIQHKD
jgi:hypothetical protein